MLAASGYGQTALTLFENRCAACHSGSGARGGLDMTSRESLLRGGGRGAAVIPGKAGESLLYKAVAHEAEPGPEQRRIEELERYHVLLPQGPMNPGDHRSL